MRYRIQIVFFCISAFICTYFVGFSQSPTPFISSITLEAKQINGLIYPHHPFINYLIDDFEHGFEFQVRTKTYGRTSYDAYYRFPSLGIAYQNISLGNPQKLGRTSALFAVFDSPIIASNHFTCGYQGNFGIAMAHKSLSESTYNNLLSSKYNYYIGFDFYTEYSWLSKNNIRLALELSHMSNGKIITPNIGINSYQLSVAYSRKLWENKEIKPQIEKLHIPRTHGVNIGIFGGLKSDDYLTEKLYPTSTIDLDYEFHCFPKYSIAAGFDIFYDNSLQALRPLFTKISDHINIIEYGIHLGTYIHYSHMCFIVQAGKYIKADTKKPDYYSRVGLRYNWDRYFINLGLKSHKTTADFIEIGGGYRITWKKN